jgi:ribosomal protein S15P/S13E
MELMSQDIKILLKKFQIDNVKDITKYEQAFTLLTKANKSNPFRKLA